MKGALLIAYDGSDDARAAAGNIWSTILAEAKRADAAA
jgi:hypothetical protein